MDDPDGAEAELIAVNYWPLLMIFTSILVAKLLHGITTPMCSWVTHRVTLLPGNVDRIKSDIIELKKELDTVSITSDFPTHARLKRRQVAKESELKHLEGAHRTSVYKRQAMLEAIMFIVLECVTVGMVLYYRSVPVVTLPVDYLWPVSSILQFPNQVAGSIGAPFWALCTRYTLERITAVLFNK